MDVVCPFCKSACEAPESFRGKRVVCPVCNQAFFIDGGMRHFVMRYKLVTVVLIGVLAVALVVYILASRMSNGETTSTSSRVSNGGTVDPNPHLPLPNSNAESRTANRNILPSCVTIETILGTGSGFFFEKNGRMYVVTSAHVVKDVPFVIVRDPKGNEYSASDAYFAADRDLALLSFKNNVPLGNSLTVISELGSLPLDVPVESFGDSDGKGVIVKSEGRLLGVGPKEIETDAQIVPGNSGGPIVLKETGEVIGVASHATRNGDVWLDGTRFNNQTRRFGVRIDNIDINRLLSNRSKLLRSDDYGRIELWGLNHEKDIWVKCILYAARNGSATAQYSLGLYLESKLNDPQVKPDIKEIIKLYEKAAESGYVFAVFHLAELNIEGEKIPKNETKAFHYFSAAEKSSDFSKLPITHRAKCYFFLGNQYYGDVTHTNNRTKALSYYMKSSELGNDMAAFMLGFCYENGDGVAIDKGKAFDCYLLAEQRGNPAAMLSLGRCYFEGIGVDPDPANALWHLLKAKANGMGAIATKYIDERYVLSERIPWKGMAEKPALLWRLKSEPQTTEHVISENECKAIGFSSVSEASGVWDL